MMPHIIPGGRQRASSDGDVLEDEEDTINASGVLDRLTEAHRNVSRSAILSTTDDSDDSRSYTETNKINTHVSKKKGLRAKLSFKSVKKAVSRALQKDNLFGSASSLNKEEMPSTVRTSPATGVWTPTLRRRAGDEEIDRPDGPPLDHRSGRDGEGQVTDSVSRPLITDPSMLIAKWERTPGNVGIHNHGNTCFMNAVLQCLSHTDSFSEYFITDLYKDDLKNTRNSAKKLGSKGPKGDVTEQLGLLLKYLWTDKYNSEISIDFKAIVGKYNVQYKGNSQHDAQEFLLWLLDRVHEDLMLPSPSQPQGKKKGKQTKNVVGPSRSLSDVELADAAESSLTSSFVSRLFQALHRSSLTCPHCNKHSNTFDPYLCVSLPLPQKCLRPVYVTVVALNEQPREVRIGLNLNVYDTVRELRDAVAADTKIPASQLVLCHLSKDGFHATYSNEQPLSDVPESNHVYAIEMHPSESEPAGQSACYETPTIQILLLHVETDRHSPERFCSPEVIQISRETNLKNLQKEILHRLGDAVKREVFAQRLHSLFRLQIVDGSSRKTYLSEEVQMPLYTETVDRVLSMFGEEFGPQHLKLIAEWNPEVKEAVIQDDMEHFVEHVSVNRVQASATQPVEISLDECFQLYTQEEKLAGEDAWLCPHCKKPQKGATKTLGLWSLPDILVLHLKRFKQTGMRRNKLNMLVNFPVDNLDMTTHVVQQGIQVRDDMVYDLIGVANHYGNMNGGHYTAFCKNTVDGTWRNFDDRRVQALASDQVVTKSAYILFYQRRSLTKLINQRLHTATHWVFSLESLMKPHSDKSTSPQRRNSLGSPTKRGDGYGDDLRQAGIAPIVRRPFSKEWNGPSSPTRRPNIRPLTPQPQRKHMPFAMDNYDQSPTVIKPKPLFKTSRPTLSRQLSDAAVRAKRPPTQDPGMTDGHQRPADKGTDSGYRSSASGQFQPQSLQVQLPPRPSTSARSPDILGTDVPKGRSSDILQPQQVQLPPKQQQEDGQDRRVLQQHRSSAAFKGTEQARVGSQSSRVSGSSSYHSEAQPPSVDVRVVDSPSFHSYQDHPACVRVIQQPVSIPPRSGRPWQYESQSSQSSRDTQSSQDSHSPQGDHVVTKTHFSNGQETFDWRQPEASTGAEVTARPKPTSSNGPRVVTAKPPVPPKTITGRTADAWRKVDSGRSAGSSSSETNAMLQPVAGTSSSLTSPPSPAPRESVRDIQRRISQRQAQQPEGLTQGERRAGPRDGPQEAPQVADRQAPDERPILREGQFNQLRNRFSDIPGEQVQGRRRSQNLADQKFATIARGNRDARSEPRDPIAPPMVPRSATDHNIKFSSYGNYSPSHLSQQAQRSLAVGSRYSPQSDRTSFSSGSGGYPRSEWDRDHRYPAERDSVPVAPLYASRDQSSSVRENRTHIYRGPMFQLHRPRKTNESDAPSLRESSV